MQLCSPTNSQLPLFRSPTQKPNSKPTSRIPHNSHSCTSTTTSSSQSLLLVPPRGSTQSHTKALPKGDEESGFDGVLLVRRPVKEFSPEEEEEEEEEQQQEDKEKSGDVGHNEASGPPSSSESPEVAATGIDEGLNGIAKKMPMFEPLQRVGVGPDKKPLAVNLELGLYRAKVMGRNFRFKDAEKILRKCIFYWPEDGRAYVALGKILSKQSKYSEAKLVYETGSQATQGENPYIWQCWAVLENKLGNFRRARELFDAATAADQKHVAAWHGWAVLEIKQGNIAKARSLLGKGLRYCGGNEYIYQTLALLEAKANRVEQARYLFQRATVANPKSCASWLAWAQLEVQQENRVFARKLFEKAVQASPKNRFAWHVWAIFEASQGEIDKGRKLLKIGHTLNPRDPVLLQSLALLEYRHSSANLARSLFRKASHLDPKHQPVWMAWGWMEWKEGNITTARELYQKALSIDSTSETAARCLQAWGVLEQRLGNQSAARRLFRSSLNINSQSYVTWMTWASFEEDQGNAVRAEEIRNLYFQQRTEVVDDASWIMGFMDIIDPAVDSIKKFLNLDQSSDLKRQDAFREIEERIRGSSQPAEVPSSVLTEGDSERADVSAEKDFFVENDFDLDTFIRDKLSLEASKLNITMEMSSTGKIMSSRMIWKAGYKSTLAQP